MGDWREDLETKESRDPDIPGFFCDPPAPPKYSTEPDCFTAFPLLVKSTREAAMDDGAEPKTEIVKLLGMFHDLK